MESTIYTLLDQLYPPVYPPRCPKTTEKQTFKKQFAWYKKDGTSYRQAGKRCNPGSYDHLSDSPVITDSDCSEPSSWGGFSEDDDDDEDIEAIPNPPDDFGIPVNPDDLDDEHRPAPTVYDLQRSINFYFAKHRGF